VIALSQRAGDEWLSNTASLAKLEIERPLLPEQTRRFADISLRLRSHGPDIVAQYERALAVGLMKAGDVPSAERHFNRAKRIYEGLHSAPGLLDLQRIQQETTASSVPATPAVRPDPEGRTAANVLQNIAALLLHARRPELVATGVVAVLADTGCVISAEATARAEDGAVERLASCQAPSESLNEPAAPARTFAIGTARSRAIAVHVVPRLDLESAATVNAVGLLLGTVSDLERAHAEREERLTLWPLEDVPADLDQAVITGRMAELMKVVRRVARTNISVLITGESGTGKEIVARAVHGYSARAEQRFTPFNCTAVPREMLESQLFGHRRGAFTGADRDNPGLIRATRDGTLFLDEIGELGLDLQPKLLRFLESGEINPLGEPSPFTVDVRIIAATNSNLEEMVRDGRFREDLFYRLNVIRLEIPPLRERRDEIPALVHHFVAQAAKEFAKGRPRVAEETMEHLLLYRWPGNIRQLHNELRRMVALAEPDGVLTPAALSPELQRATARPPRSANGLEIDVPLTEKLPTTLSRIEREMIRVALRTHQGRVEAAAKALGISRKGLYLKRQRLGL
jgi:DNA-binding NtrC family response regulator